MSREILKIRIDADGVLVKYTKGEGLKSETVTLEASDPPLPELELSLATMAVHLCEIAELPEEWSEDIEVRGCTVTHNEGVTGLVITGLRSLEGSDTPLVLNTPHFTDCARSETDESGKGIYSKDCAKALAKLTEAAFAYVDGHRGQLELDLEPPAAVNQ